MTEVLIMAASPTRRVWLTEVFGAIPDVRVAGVAPTFAFLRSLIDEIGGDVVVIEVDSPSESDTNREWLTELSELAALIILLPAADPWIFSTVARAERGALLRADASSEQLVQAVRTVSTGLLVFEPALVPHPETHDVPEGLTPRESEVLALLADGLGNREIASRLSISEHTVKFHIRSILGKLGASSRTEAVTRGLRSGLIDL